MALLAAASNGDILEITRLAARGVNLNVADYDGRTAAHLAASEGQIGVLEYLIKRKVKLNAVDRWGGKPLDDAKREKHKKAVALLKEHS